MKMSSKISFFRRVGTEIKKDFRNIGIEMKEGAEVVREFFLGPKKIKYRKFSEIHRNSKCN